jgi:hypothetical protein
LLIEGLRDSTVDFTRQPIIETVITPKDGYRLAVRSSKNLGQEEFVVEALEVVSFGMHCFFRNLDRSKAFLVPVSDYEVIEIREGRLPIKAASLEGVVKIPSVKEYSRLPAKEQEKREPSFGPKEPIALQTETLVIEEKSMPEVSSPAGEIRNERRKDRKQKQKKRRVEDEESSIERGDRPSSPVTRREGVGENASSSSISSQVSSSSPVILPPPTTLIRDDLERLRNSETYKGAFYNKVAPPSEEDDDFPTIPLSLQGDEEPIIKAPEQFSSPIEEDAYKATPAPLEEENRPHW